MCSGTEEMAIKFYKVQSMGRVSAFCIAKLLWIREIKRYRNEISINGRKTSLPTVKYVVHESVTRSASLFILPKQSKIILGDMISVTKEIIFEWISYHDLLFFDDKAHRFLHCLRWTSDTIDYLRTARAIIEEDELDVYIKGKLICVYCMDDQMTSLDAITKSDKESSQKLWNSTHSIIMYWTAPWDINIAERLWTSAEAYKQSQPLVQTVHEYVLYDAVEKQYEVAVRYLFDKLDSHAKSKHLLSITEKVVKSPFPNDSLIIYFITQLTYEELYEIINIEPRFICKFVRSIFKYHLVMPLIFTSNNLLSYTKVLNDLIYYPYESYAYHRLFALVLKYMPDVCKKIIFGDMHTEEYLTGNLILPLIEQQKFDLLLLIFGEFITHANPDPSIYPSYLNMIISSGTCLNKLYRILLKSEKFTMFARLQRRKLIRPNITDALKERISREEMEELSIRNSQLSANEMAGIKSILSSSLKNTPASFFIKLFVYPESIDLNKVMRCLTSSTKVETLKKELWRKRSVAFPVCEEFIELERYGSVERFLQWVFEDEQAIDNFKNKLFRRSRRILSILSKMTSCEKIMTLVALLNPSSETAEIIIRKGNLHKNKIIYEMLDEYLMANEKSDEGKIFNCFRMKQMKDINTVSKKLEDAASMCCAHFGIITLAFSHNLTIYSLNL